MMKRQLHSVFSNALLVARKPQLLRRGNNPFTWAIQRAIAEYKFESVRVDEVELVSFLTGSSPEKSKALLAKSSASVPLLYLLVRALQPEIVVETGVEAGSSSSSILLALEENARGNLYSIDLPSEKRFEDGNIYQIREVGHMVPHDLRYRWNLVLGDAREELPPLLARLGVIDMFIHDSLHTEKHMMWEYETAWPRLRQGGVLLSHDISVSFLQFARQAGRTFKCCGVTSTKYGGITK
jgi:predicted O-methyltransferase YrrM